MIHSTLNFTMITHFNLRAGDMILLDGQHAKVKSVNESSALVEVPRPPRSFTTTFGETITLQPRPALVRISPNSEVPILNR